MAQFDFRFLVICLEPHKEKGIVSLGHVVDTLTVSKSDLPTDIKMFAIIGAVLVPEMHGKKLALTAWSLDSDGERRPLVQWAGTHPILPPEIGAACCSYPISVPIWEPGLYGFDLLDPHGVFGQCGRLLASYLYGVVAT